MILGLFGVLWYNINNRKSEIGLRCALGATRDYIHKQFIGEMMVIATLGIIPGLIITIQFPILNVFNLESLVYYLAIAISILTIYILIIICALLPSAQAAKIKPATALHEE